MVASTTVEVTVKSRMVDRSTDSSDAIVVFRVALSSLVGAALALMDSSTATCTVSALVGEGVGTRDGWLFPGMVGAGVVGAGVVGAGEEGAGVGGEEGAGVGRRDGRRDGEGLGAGVVDGVQVGEHVGLRVPPLI